MLIQFLKRQLDVLVSHLDCIHDTVGEDSHLSCDGLHSLFELCDVRAGGEHAVEA